MANKQNDMVLAMLDEIRAEQDKHTAAFERIEARLLDTRRQPDDYKKIVRYTLGQSIETQLRQTQQESRIDERFRHSEKIPSDRRPSRLDLLIEQFEKMSPEERRRTIEHANEVLRADSAKALEEKTD
jgi:hypothetical protein